MMGVVVATANGRRVEVSSKTKKLLKNQNVFRAELGVQRNESKNRKR